MTGSGFLRRANEYGKRLANAKDEASARRICRNLFICYLQSEDIPIPERATAVDREPKPAEPDDMHETRSSKNCNAGRRRAYRHEMTDADHAAMLSQIGQLKGAVVLSGYPSQLYDRNLKDWHRVTCKALADGARERTEVLWLNPKAAGQLNAQLPFAGAAA